MKDIKDYLPYYVGSSVFLCNNLEGNPVIEPLTPKMLYEDEEMFTDPENGPYRLMLRRLSDMTEEEAVFIINNYNFRSVDMPMKERLFGIEIAKRLSEQMEVANYLLKQGFDLWGLIDAGLAVDVKQVNKQP